MRRFHGLYRGKVVENDDSGEKFPYYGAVKVRVIEIYGEKEPNEKLPWAYAMTPFGQGEDEEGNEYCSLNIPRVDTWVWVLFEHGDPMRPVYVGSWIGGDPSELIDEFKTDDRSSAKYPDIQGWKFGFAEGSFTVRIIDDRRLEVKFDDNNIIEIDAMGDRPNEEKQIVVRTEWLIRLKSDKKIKLEAPIIELAAEDELILDSEGSTDVGGAGVTTVKGATILGDGAVAGSFEHPSR